MTAREVAAVFRARRSGKGRWQAKCPSHDDRTPSLSIKEGKRAVLVRCWGGCDVEQVVSSAGLRMSDLWYEQKADPKAIREAEKRREYGEAVRNKWLLQYRNRIADLERWSRVAAALYWHLQRNPHDLRVSGWYEEALDRCLGDPAPWPKHQPYCPFPPHRLLHNIKPSHTTPEIARFLKLRG